MKNIFLSASAALLISLDASAQQTPASDQQNNQQNVQTPPPASSGSTTVTQPAPVNNKIAVSDPGVPVENKPASTKKAATKSTERKKKSAGSNTGVTPK